MKPSPHSLQTAIFIGICFFAIALFAQSPENLERNMNSEVLTMRVDQEGRTQFFDGNVGNAEKVVWENVNETNNQFGDIQFRNRHRPNPGYGTPPPANYGNPYYPNNYYPSYPPYYPIYGGGVPRYYYICGTYGFWPFIYYQYCW